MVLGRMSALAPDVVTGAAVGEGAVATTAGDGHVGRDRAPSEPAATPEPETVHDPAPVHEHPAEREPATATAATPEFAARSEDTTSTSPPPRRRTGRFLRRRRTSDDRAPSAR
jgi:hypothetical protein